MVTLLGGHKLLLTLPALPFWIGFLVSVRDELSRKQMLPRVRRLIIDFPSFVLYVIGEALKDFFNRYKFKIAVVMAIGLLVVNIINEIPVGGDETLGKQIANVLLQWALGYGNDSIKMPLMAALPLFILSVLVIVPLSVLSYIVAVPFIGAYPMGKFFENGFNGTGYEVTRFVISVIGTIAVVSYASEKYKKYRNKMADRKIRSNETNR